MHRGALDHVEGAGHGFRECRSLLACAPSRSRPKHLKVEVAQDGAEPTARIASADRRSLERGDVGVLREIVREVYVRNEVPRECADPTGLFEEKLAVDRSRRNHGVDPWNAAHAGTVARNP